MKSLAVRLALVGLFVVAAGSAAYFLWTGETHVRQSNTDARAFDATALDAERSVLDVRAAHAAYVAAGQGEDFWTAKVASSMAAINDALAGLRARARSSEAQSSIDNARSDLADFEQLDRRARGYLRSGQRLLASDLIFADGFEMTAAISASIEGARHAEAASRDAVHAATRRAEAISLGAAGIVALAVLSLLIPRPVTPGEGHAERDSVPAVPAQAQFSSDFATARGPQAAPIPLPALEPPVDLPSIASVCSDLARVVDSRALPALLGRAAGALDAPGIVLWIADPDGRELAPIVTFGYAQPMVLRLGTILRDAENATAAAFRTSLLQTVAADAVSNGAIAAPLVTPAGCVGVMAAEVRHRAEKDSIKLAAATIVAAQLATLVGPPSTRAQARADAM